MLKLRILVVCVLPMLIASAEEKTRGTKTFTVDKQPVTITIGEFIPPLVVKKDSALMNQASAVGCSLLFYSCLAKGDIDGAAALCNDPGKLKEKYQRQKDRAGEEEFIKMYAGYFGGTASIKYHFLLGKSHMLIVHSEEIGVDVAQFYVEDSGKFFVDDRGSADQDRLGKIFQLLKNEEGNVSVK